MSFCPLCATHCLTTALQCYPFFHYRDDYDRSNAGSVGVCKPCECNGNEQSCKLENEKLICLCKDGFEGESCEKISGSPGKCVYEFYKELIQLDLRDKVELEEIPFVKRSYSN